MPQKKFNGEQTKQIIDLYHSSSMSGSEIARIYDCHPCTINRLIKKYSYTKDLCDCRRKYNIDKNYFSQIDTEEKAYLLGLMFSDGCVYGTHVIFLQAEQDKNLVYKFKSCLSSNHPIQIINRTGNEQNVYRFDVSCKKMTEDLIKLGCKPNKTFDLDFPNIKNSLIRHFVRGYFDGDGCIYYYHKRKTPQGSICFVGTDSFCLSLINIIEEHCSVRCRIRPHRLTKGISQVETAGNKKVASIFHWLYDNSLIYGDRKYKRFYEFYSSYKL